MSDLTYRCPLCQQNIAVAPALVGQQIDCPHCEHPIKVDAPVARLIEETSPDDREIDRVVSPVNSEELIQTVHPVMFRAHPFYYLLLVACLLGGLVIGLGGRYFNLPWNTMIDWIIGGTLAGTGAVALFVWWVKTLGVTLEVTSKRTRLTRGLIAKASSEVQHDDVRNIQVDQTFIGRLVNVGALAISSSGQDDLEIEAKGLPGPGQIAELIRDRQ